MPTGWLDLLSGALGDEFGAAPRVCTLATVSPEGDPAARTVICRRIDQTGMFYFTSDARSEKNRHLRSKPGVEIVFWLPTRRVQFRIKAFARAATGIEHAELRREFWRELSFASRALFFWPPPGEMLVEDASAFPAEVDWMEPPGTFEVIRAKPLIVERLDLNTQPHDRRRWHVQREWQEERLNP
jgi:pyridoxamine 5'-phosphate oxidase